MKRLGSNVASIVKGVGTRARDSVREGERDSRRDSRRESGRMSARDGEKDRERERKQTNRGGMPRGASEGNLTLLACIG